MRVFSQALQAGVRTQIIIPGRFFMLVEASTCDVEFLDDAAAVQGEKASAVSSGYKRFPGDWKEARDRFSGFAITSVGGQTATIAVSESAGDYERFVTTVLSSLPNGFTSTADVSTSSAAATQVLAANANRRKAIVRNISAAGLDLRIGDSSITTTRGMRLSPGESIDIEGSQAIYVIRESGDVTVALLEEIRT